MSNLVNYHKSTLCFCLLNVTALTPGRFMTRWNMLSEDSDLKSKLETSETGNKRGCSLKTWSSCTQREKLSGRCFSFQAQLFKKKKKSRGSYAVQALPLQLPAVKNRRLLGAGALRLYLQLWELELLLLALALAHILLRRGGQVGFALGEEVFQRLSGRTLGHVWRGWGRPGAGVTVLLLLLLLLGVQRNKELHGWHLLTDDSCSCRLIFCASRGAQVWRHAPVSPDCLWHSFTNDALFSAP